MIATFLSITITDVLHCAQLNKESLFCKKKQLLIETLGISLRKLQNKALPNST